MFIKRSVIFAAFKAVRKGIVPFKLSRLQWKIFFCFLDIIFANQNIFYTFASPKRVE